MTATASRQSKPLCRSMSSTSETGPGGSEGSATAGGVCGRTGNSVTVAGPVCALARTGSSTVASEPAGASKWAIARTDSSTFAFGCIDSSRCGRRLVGRIVFGLRPLTWSDRRLGRRHRCGCRRRREQARIGREVHLGEKLRELERWLEIDNLRRVFAHKLIRYPAIVIATPG